jgi:alkylation response protein AidB-like acyl-CoA dehydrogenase
MTLQLMASTRPGRQLVALAEELAAGFAECAGFHDRQASYPFASIDALRERGYFAAPVPEALGGLGVTSVHDILIASSRLARGDASIAIGVNMHLAAVINLLRRHSVAVAAGNERRIRAIGQSLEQIARDGVVMAAAISEPNQDLTRPATTATRTPDGGWRIDGRKIFCTMSPAATVLYTAVSLIDHEGTERYGFAMVPTDAPGLTINDDWDAMGMRASGSHSVTLDAVPLPPEALRGGFRVGDPVPYMERNLAAGLFHAAASLGIAEAAHGTAVHSLAKKSGGGDARSRMLVAENAIDLGASRATLSHSAGLIDELYAAYPTADEPAEAIVDVFTAAQVAKTFINEAAVRVVDRALSLSGGAGYFNGHPLGRAYRDVRAGAFMHPLGANRAYEFVGQVALGLDPGLR